MRKFRKIPVVIEAEQWFKQGDVPEAPIKKAIFDDKSYIETLEGQYPMKPGLWVVKGVEGEFYPVQPDIFLKTFEAVETSFGLGQK